LSRVTPKFFALWEGNTVELSTMIEIYLSGQAFPGRKNSSVLLSLRWWVDIQVDISAWHVEILGCQKGGRSVLECCPHSNDRRDHVRI
jgi:hypothetical protein